MLLLPEQEPLAVLDARVRLESPQGFGVNVHVPEEFDVCMISGTPTPPCS